MHKGPWIVWPEPSTGAISVSYRMCSACGFTQILAIDVLNTGWQDIPNSVIGTSCTDQPALDPQQAGYTQPPAIS